MLDRLPPGDKASIEQAIDEVDPLRRADRLRDRARQGKVLMINAAEDEVIPRASTEKLAAALGMADRVVWLPGLGHYTALAALPQALRTTADFFAQDMPPGVKPIAPATAARSPERTLVSLVRQLGDLLTGEPGEGHCHFADMEVSATPNDGKPISGRLRLVRGPKSKFSVYGKLSDLGEARLGYGEHPWMVSREGNVLAGVLPAGGKPLDPQALVDPKHLLKLQMVSGLLTTLTMAPDVLDRWVTITDDTGADRAPAIRITRKDKRQDHLRIVLQDDRTTPRGATFDAEGVRGSVTFHAWQLNAVAHESLFREPAGLPTKEVDQSDLVRMFSALFNFAMESIQ
jgi:hypothetical protein